MVVGPSRACTCGAIMLGAVILEIFHHVRLLLRILALTRKELLAVLKDPRGRTSLLIPPIFQCLIFGYAASYDLNDVPYAVLDQDHSFASHELAGPARKAAALFIAWPICSRRRTSNPGSIPAALCWSCRSPRILSGKLQSGQQGRRAIDRRRTQFQHRRHRHGLRGRHGRFLQHRLAARPTACRLRRRGSSTAPGTIPIWKRAGT